MWMAAATVIVFLLGAWIAVLMARRSRRRGYYGGDNWGHFDAGGGYDAGVTANDCGVQDRPAAGFWDSVGDFFGGLDLGDGGLGDGGDGGGDGGGGD